MYFTASIDEHLCLITHGNLFLFFYDKIVQSNREQALAQTAVGKITICGADQSECSAANKGKKEKLLPS